MGGFFSEIGENFGAIAGGTLGAIFGGPQGAVQGAKLGRSLQQTIQGDSAPVNNDRTNAKEDPNYRPDSDGFMGFFESFTGGGTADKQSYGSYYYNPDGTRKDTGPEWVSYISDAAQAYQLFA